MRRVGANREYNSTKLIVALVACSMLGVLLMAGIMYWFLPLHGGGATWMNERVFQQRQIQQVEDNNAKQLQRQILDNQKRLFVSQSNNKDLDGDTILENMDDISVQDKATELDATQDNVLKESINIDNIEQYNILGITPDVIKNILMNNRVNLIVIGATIVLIGFLVWLLKKNTDMRILSPEDMRDRAAEAVAYATDMFNQAKDLVYKVHQYPDDQQLEEEAMAVLQGTDEAIDIASELVAEYIEFMKQYEQYEEDQYYQQDQQNQTMVA